MTTRTVILLCFISLVTVSRTSANPILKKDSAIAPFHKINFAFTWFELGGSISFHEKKLQKLPHGLNSYLYGQKGGLAASLFGIGFYYKNRFGLSAILLFQDYSVPDAAFRTFLSTQFPGYYLPNQELGHTYTLYKINYRISYRFKKRNTIYEPQFQLGVNDCDDFNTHFVLKADGSNQFVEYDIVGKNKRKNLLSYHAALRTMWCFSKPESRWVVEPGIRVDLMVIPTNFKYIITSTPYNAPATVYEVNVKRMRPAITITAFLNFLVK